jgi:hypothetical protein
MEFKKGDKIIWDSHFGYEIGYFIEDSKHQMYDSYKIDLITGIVQGESLRPSSEIKPYNEETFKEVCEKYNRKKIF